SFIRSSTTFKEKIELPVCWRFRQRVWPSIVFDKLEVRRHTGLFWGRRREKECALIDDGRLLIYSTFDRGLSISLPELSFLRFSVAGKEVMGIDDNAMMCEVEMRRGKEKLRMTIRGVDKISRWRDAIARASQGLTPAEQMEGIKNGYSWSWRGTLLSTTRSAMSSRGTVTRGTLTLKSPIVEKSSNFSTDPPPALNAQSISMNQLPIDDSNHPSTVSSPIVPSRKISMAIPSTSVLTEDETTIYRSALSHRENSLPRLRSESLLLYSLCDQSTLNEEDDD
ncbi:hypothetical protein PFISCL1PPCAC_25104, partial [Pristionchus fissidentatus]